MRYIHYGSNCFDRERFMPVKNRPDMVKPDGGLWASRENAKYGWYQWAKDINSFAHNLDTSFEFSLADNARILLIDTVMQLDGLPKNKNTIFSQIEALSSLSASSLWTFLDFELLSESYDAIEVLISEDHRLYERLYTLDCDSIIVTNLDIIIPA